MIIYHTFENFMLFSVQVLELIQRKAAWILRVASFLFAGSFGTLASASLRKQAEAKKKTEDRSMRWDVPNVDGPVKAVTLASPCVLSDVLKQAGVRSKEMEENLSNFTADETIQYEFFGPGNLPDYQTGTFEYLAVLKPTRWGASVQETRTSTKGTRLFPGSTRDRGLPGLASFFFQRCKPSTT
jgi:hypothetical protein